MKHDRKRKHRILAALASATLLLAAFAPTAHAAEAYEAAYKGPGVPMVEEGADFFAHMDPFTGGKSQAGSLRFTNETASKCVLHLGLEEFSDESEGALAGAMQLSVWSSDGSRIFDGPLDGSTVDGPIEVSELSPGSSLDIHFSVTAPSDVAANHAGERASTTWAFYVTDGGDTTRQDGVKVDGRLKPLPKTGDSPAAAIAAATAAAAAGICAFAFKRRKSQQGIENGKEVRR